MKSRADILFFIITLLAILIFFGLNLSLGDVELNLNEILSILGGGTVENPVASYIVEDRLNRSLTAIAAGGGLGVAGLVLQVFFRNPLAGPGVLGVTSGASLGVAAVLLGGVTMASFIGSLGIILAGVIGAIGILFLLLLVSRFIYNSITLLVVGLMFSYFTSAIINVLFLWASETSTRAYVVWGFGSFEGMLNWDLMIFLLIITIIFLASFLLVKPLNALVIGTHYASSLGIDIKRVRILIILITGILAAIVTVYCGPVGFIGIAVPQLVRELVRSTNHAVILQAVFLGGGLLALLADFLVRMSGNMLPLNTVTALIGAPIIIWVIIKMNAKNARA